MTNPQNQENRDPDISGDECARGPVAGIEDGESVAQKQEKEEEQADSRSVGLEAGRIRRSYSLCSARLPES